MCVTEIRLRPATRQGKRDRDRRDEPASPLDRAHTRNEILLRATCDVTACTVPVTGLSTGPTGSSAS
ncbi:MAG: hypothetical protein QOI78_3632 [Actinomycetota bacterium]|jgi:hypothetical protein|nr:hypothetical protein [Actinomycetota bacterium]